VHVGAVVDHALLEVATEERDEIPVPAVAIGSGSSAVDASPSRERLVRIATMIRDVEHAMPMTSRRTRRQQGARPIPLAAGRLRSARVNPSRTAAPAVVELAS
jgi:hypothetical protein